MKRTLAEWQKIIEDRMEFWDKSLDRINEKVYNTYFEEVAEDTMTREELDMHMLLIFYHSSFIASVIENTLQSDPDLFPKDLLDAFKQTALSDGARISTKYMDKLPPATVEEDVELKFTMKGGDA